MTGEQIQLFKDYEMNRCQVNAAVDQFNKDKIPSRKLAELMVKRDKLQEDILSYIKTDGQPMSKFEALGKLARIQERSHLDGDYDNNEVACLSNTMYNLIEFLIEYVRREAIVKRQYTYAEAIIE